MLRISDKMQISSSYSHSSAIRLNRISKTIPAITKGEENKVHSSLLPSLRFASLMPRAFLEQIPCTTQCVELTPLERNKEKWNKISAPWCEYIDEGNDPYNKYFTGPAFEEFIDLKSVNGKTILDAGSGSGRLTRKLAAHGANVVGLDFSEKNIEYAEKKQKEESVAPGTVCYRLGSFTEDIEAFQEKFDVVMSSMAAFMDSDEPEVTAKNFYKWLKPGGRLLISMKHPWTLPRKKGSVTFLKKEQSYRYTPRQSYFSQQPFKKNVTINGKDYQIPHYPFMLSNTVTTLLDTGFSLVKSLESLPPKDKKFADWQVLPFSWMMELRKPEQTRKKQDTFSIEGLRLRVVQAIKFIPLTKNFEFQGKLFHKDFLENQQSFKQPIALGLSYQSFPFGLYTLDPSIIKSEIRQKKIKELQAKLLRLQRKFEAAQTRTYELERKVRELQDMPEKWEVLMYPVSPHIQSIKQFKQELAYFKRELLTPDGILVIVLEHPLWRLSKLAPKQKKKPQPENNAPPQTEFNKLNGLSKIDSDGNTKTLVSYHMKKSYFESELTASALLKAVNDAGFEVKALEEPELDDRSVKTHGKTIQGNAKLSQLGQVVPLSLVIYALNK